MSNALKLKPIVKSYIWGGTYFKQFKKTDEDIVAELWELSIRDDFNCTLEDGRLLKDVLNKSDFGPNADRFPYFPILIKLIDAKDNLSVQVHPSDEYALKYEHSFGKSEMWHIISADKGAGIYIGFKNDTSKEEVETKLNNGQILDLLNFVEVKEGDTYIINPGTIHAIGGGVRLIEIQQNSNITYRLFDYNRLDKEGNPRPLHIKQALEVIDYHKYNFNNSNSSLLADTPYFKVEKIEFDKELELKADQGSFLSFTFIKVEGQVDDISYQIYDSFFLPNGKSCKIKGKGTVIISRV